MFFERLKKACFDKGITVSRLLRELGFSSSSVTYWRKGSVPKIDKLVKISQYLDVSVEYLIEGGIHGVPYSSNTVSKSLINENRIGETDSACYNLDNGQKSSDTSRELGRLEGRIEELEKKIAEYKKIIEDRDSQLRDIIEKMAEQKNHGKKKQ